MKRRYGHSMFALKSVDKATTAERVVRQRDRDVKKPKTKQEKKELNTWEGEGGKASPISPST